MRQYIRNILIYLVALFAIVAFITLFSNSLQIYDSVRDEWVTYKVNAYVGEENQYGITYRGSIIPVFGFIIPLVIAFILFFESFKKSWSGKLKIVNTALAVILFLCILCVLLTKELFLSVNNLGESTMIRNGPGPTVSAIASSCGCILLLLVTWIPFKNDIKFIDR